jgi:branched-chain amino acid transport system permease protein
VTKKKVFYGILFVVLLAFPFIDTNQYHVYILDRVLLNCIVASGLVTLTGFAGQMSLGHAAFYGIGAYTSALLTLRLGAPIWVGIVAAGFLCMIVGILLSLPSFKVSGFYLSLVTIAFGNIVWLLIINWQNLTGGPLGLLSIPPIKLGGQPVGKIGFYYIALLVLIFIYLVSLRLARSYLGRAMRAMRDDEGAAETAGINIKSLKLMVFSISAVYAGIAGGLYAHLANFLSPESFTFAESSNFVAMSVVGGLQHMFGGILGGLAVTALPELLRVKGWEIYYLMGTSLGILLLVIFLPSGLAPTLQKGLDRLFGVKKTTAGKGDAWRGGGR